LWTRTTFFPAEWNFLANFCLAHTSDCEVDVVFCAKETPDIKVVVAFVTFGIIVQFLFLLAGAR
jgi:hypothetical protein